MSKVQKASWQELWEKAFFLTWEMAFENRAFHGFDFCSSSQCILEKLQVQVKNTFLHFVHGSMEINEERHGMAFAKIANGKRGKKLQGNAIIPGDLAHTHTHTSNNHQQYLWQEPEEEFLPGSIVLFDQLSETGWVYVKPNASPKTSQKKKSSTWAAFIITNLEGIEIKHVMSVNQ